MKRLLGHANENIQIDNFQFTDLKKVSEINTKWHTHTHSFNLDYLNHKRHRV